MKTVELLSYILHHISLPMVQAMTERGNDNRSEEEITSLVIQLLEKVIQQSEDLKEVLEVSAQDKEHPALRMHIASLCAKIIASEFKNTGKIPSDTYIRNAISMIDASLVFCENYIPLQNLSDVYPENANRPASFLKNLADLKYLESALPIVNAIGAFSFGVPHQKMIQNVSEKLAYYTTDMRDRILGSQLHYLEQKEASRYILHNLAALYQTVHMHELKRVESLTLEQLQNESSEQQITNIWDSFHAQYIMLLELTRNMLPESQPAPPPVSAPVATTENIDEMLNDPFIGLKSPLEEEEEASGENGEGEQQQAFKPMSFYKKSD